MTTIRPELSPTARSTVGRLREHARTDRAELYAVLDAGLVCHLGLVVDGSPIVLPTGYGRGRGAHADTVYVHGSTGARYLRTAAAGVPVCLTVTHVDGVVYARSVFHHSMNYRSAVVHGVIRAVVDEVERLAGLRAVVEQLAPGSWDHARRPSARELAATAVLALDLAEASVKIRTGARVDDDADVAAGGRWAGVLPVRTAFGEPQPCPLLDGTVPPPEHVASRASAPVHVADDPTSS